MKDTKFKFGMGYDDLFQREWIFCLFVCVHVCFSMLDAGRR